VCANRIFIHYLYPRTGRDFRLLTILLAPRRDRIYCTMIKRIIVQCYNGLHDFCNFTNLSVILSPALYERACFFSHNGKRLKARARLKAFFSKEKKHSLHSHRWMRRNAIAVAIEYRAQISFLDFSDGGDHAAKLRSRVIDLRMTGGGRRVGRGRGEEGKGPPDGIGEQTRYLRGHAQTRHALPPARIFPSRTGVYRRNLTP